MTRQVNVDPGRLAGWVERFASRHGEPVVSWEDGVRLDAPDGASALLTLPWPASPPTSEPLAHLLAEATRVRTVGIVLVRKQRFAVGLATGTTVTAFLAGRHHVNGRTKAGGWSQQRYARRRDNQAQRTYDDAAQAVRELLESRAAHLDAVLLAGDTSGLASVLAAPGCARVAALAARDDLVRLPIPDPTREVLAAYPARFAQVRVGLNELA